MTTREPYCACGHPRSWHAPAAVDFVSRSHKRAITAGPHAGACSHGCGCDAYQGGRRRAKRAESVIAASFVDTPAAMVALIWSARALADAAAAFSDAVAAAEFTQSAARVGARSSLLDSVPLAADDAASEERAPAKATKKTREGSGERRMLIAIAQHGVVGLTRRGLTVIVGLRRSTRDRYLQAMKARGEVREEGVRLFATPHGLEVLGSSFEALPVGYELRLFWIGVLPVAQGKMLHALIKAYPDSVAAAVLGEGVGLQRSTRDRYLQSIVARGLATKESKGMFRASQELFSELHSAPYVEHDPPGRKAG